MPPALLAMASVLQCYLQVSDAEAVEMTVVDLRWQMVLDHLGEQEPAFAQGTLRGFRERVIRTDMDRRLLERTSELARKTKAFDWRKLPKDLRIAVDSSPLEGAGRVEDTINLLVQDQPARDGELVAADGELEQPQVAEDVVVNGRAALGDGDRGAGELGREDERLAGAVVAELDEGVGLVLRAALGAAVERGGDAVEALGGQRLERPAVEVGRDGRAARRELGAVGGPALGLVDAGAGFAVVVEVDQATGGDIADRGDGSVQAARGELAHPASMPAH